MAIQIPHEVATFLNFVGVPYPDIDEDQVRSLAEHVRAFAASVRGTHDEATTAVNDLGSVYSGYSYQQLVAAWARMSGSHMADLDQACRVVASALRAAAVMIEMVKAAVLTELAVLAASYAAAMAATVATSGLSLAITEAIKLAARRLLTAMEQALIGYVLAEVVGKAIEPLEHVVERMINNAVHHAAADLLNLPKSGAPPKLVVDPDAVEHYASKLDRYADDILRHATEFADKAGGLTFENSSSGPAPADLAPQSVPAPELPSSHAGNPAPLATSSAPQEDHGSRAAINPGVDGQPSIGEPPVQHGPRPTGQLEPTAAAGSGGSAPASPDRIDMNSLAHQQHAQVQSTNPPSTSMDPLPAHRVSAHDHGDGGAPFTSVTTETSPHIGETPAGVIDDQLTRAPASTTTAGGLGHFTDTPHVLSPVSSDGGTGVPATAESPGIASSAGPVVGPQSPGSSAGPLSPGLSTPGRSANPWSKSATRPVRPPGPRRATAADSDATPWSKLVRVSEPARVSVAPPKPRRQRADSSDAPAVTAAPTQSQQANTT
ncbi:hypothetical protein ACFROC_21925 [Nocardia tengchongensis]|uniref:WXG100-like domain-containing protein n=1 Tax=Nocardia tengchongensis TaxID=2055889 RepID=UPI0036BE4855